MFKNITVFRYPSSCELDIDCELGPSARRRPLKPLGPMEASNAGFLAPVTFDADEYTLTSLYHAQVRIGFQAKILPPAVVKDAVAAKVQKIARDEDRKVGARERRRIVEDVVTELLPRAFTRRKAVSAVFDNARMRLLIDTASANQAENVITQIREALGSFPAVPTTPEEAPRVLLTSWLVDPSRLPARLALADEVVLYDPAAPNAAVWRGRRTDLTADDVTEHLRAGLVVKQLGLVYADRLSFVLDEDLVLRKFRYLDAALDDLDNEGPHDAWDDAKANLFLFGEETRVLLDYLDEIFDVRTLA